MLPWHDFQITNFMMNLWQVLSNYPLKICQNIKTFLLVILQSYNIKTLTPCTFVHNKIKAEHIFLRTWELSKVCKIILLVDPLAHSVSGLNQYWKYFYCPPNCYADCSRLPDLQMLLS